MNVIGSNMCLSPLRDRAKSPPLARRDPFSSKPPRVQKAKVREEDFISQVEERRARFERQDSSGNFREKGAAQKSLSRQGSKCSEFFEKPEVSLLDDLRKKFDPTGRGIEESPELYSDISLLRRESLKYDPMIIRTLEELWDVVDKNKNGMLDKDEYREFHSKLALVLIPSVSYRLSETLFNEDWERDTDGGQKKITKNVFGDSMFELADRWTDEISAPDYINFLQGAFQALSELDPSGKRVYKTDKALIDMQFTMKPFSRLHAISLQEARARAAAEERARARAFREGREFSIEEFEKEWERRKKLGQLGSSGRSSKGSSKGKGSRKSLGLEDFSISTPRDDSLLAKRHTLNGPLPGSQKNFLSSYNDEDSIEQVKRRQMEWNQKMVNGNRNNKIGAQNSLSEWSSSVSSTSKARLRQSDRIDRNEYSSSMRAATTPVEKNRQKTKTLSSDDDSLNAVASRFYPPPKSWWARHAKSRTSRDMFGSNVAFIHPQTVEAPNGHEKVGLVLFDPQMKDKIVRMVISLKTSAVHVAEVLDCSRALENGYNEVLPLSGSVSDCEIEQGSTFRHAMRRADWFNFCNQVERIMQFGRGQVPFEISFVGFASSFDTQLGVFGNNISFTSEDVASKIPSVGKRPRLGLCCPLLQGKIAKYIAHRIERAEAPTTDSPLQSKGYVILEPHNLRSSSALKLLSSIQNSGKQDPNLNQSSSSLNTHRHTFMESISTRFQFKSQRTLDKIFDSTQAEMLLPTDQELSDDLQKRHTIGELIQPKQRDEKKQALVARGKSRLTKLGSAIFDLPQRGAGGGSLNHVNSEPLLPFVP